MVRRVRIRPTPNAAWYPTPVELQGQCGRAHDADEGLVCVKLDDPSLHAGGWYYAFPCELDTLDAPTGGK